MIYDKYDPVIHLCDPEELPKRFKFVVAGVDWGWTNPGVIIVVGVDEDGRAWVVRQVYRIKQSLNWWSKMALVLQKKWGCFCFFCDPSEPDKIDELRRRGIPAVKAVNDVTLGIAAVDKRMLLAGDGKPRLRIMRESLMIRDEKLAENDHPTCLEQEIEGYVWEDAKEGVNFREKPVPFADHACDAMRYAIIGVDRMGYMFDDPSSFPKTPRRTD